MKRAASVEARSAGLRKDLGVVDLTLTQILFIIGLIAFIKGIVSSGGNSE